MIKNYPKGSDITLLNTIYLGQKKDENGKWQKDTMTIVYKDNITGEKKIEEIVQPEYEFYKIKPESGLDTSYNHLFVSEDDVETISVPYTQLKKKIAEVTDNLPFYYDNLKNGNGYANNKLHFDPRIMNSDMHIEDHYRMKFGLNYTNNIIPISKTFFDIEADTINMRGDFPEMGECPVNAVSVICEEINKTYVLLLRNPDNPLIQEFEDSINDNLFNELKLFIRNNIGGWKNEIRFGLDKMEYEFLFYDEEINLIVDLFKLIHVTKPDFVLAWNMAFDIPYLIARIQELGYNPEDIICHPDFKYKVCEYFIDERHKNEFAERGDKATIASYSVFIDQMIQFASRRKGQSAFSSMKLDYIGEKVVNVRKLDYSHITTNISKLPYLDYKTFVFYNIMDTIVQKCTESKVADIDYTFSKCILNNTRYDKCHRQTVYLTNRGGKNFREDGFIIGNNVNKQNEKPTIKFPGAFVANPKKLSEYPKRKRYGQSINVCDNGDDFDYKSLYPSEMREFNIAPHTQIGRVEIPNPIFKEENPFNDPYFTRGGAFIEDLHSGVYLEFGKRWLGLSSYSDLYKEVIEYFTTMHTSFNPVMMYNNDGLMYPIRKVSKDNFAQPIAFAREEELTRAIYCVYKKPDYDYVINNIDRRVVAPNDNDDKRDDE